MLIEKQREAARRRRSAGASSKPLRHPGRRPDPSTSSDGWEERSTGPWTSWSTRSPSRARSSRGVPGYLAGRVRARPRRLRVLARGALPRRRARYLSDGSSDDADLLRRGEGRGELQRDGCREGGAGGLRAVPRGWTSGRRGYGSTPSPPGPVRTLAACGVRVQEAPRPFREIDRSRAPPRRDMRRAKYLAPTWRRGDGRGHLRGRRLQHHRGPERRSSAVGGPRCRRTCRS